MCCHIASLVKALPHAFYQHIVPLLTLITFYSQRAHLFRLYFLVIYSLVIYSLVISLWRWLVRGVGFYCFS